MLQERQCVFSIREFCDAHRISRSRFYEMIEANQAPTLMRVGHRVLISVEAAAEWRRNAEKGLYAHG